MLKMIRAVKLHRPTRQALGLRSQSAKMIRLGQPNFLLGCVFCSLAMPKHRANGLVGPLQLLRKEITKNVQKSIKNKASLAHGTIGLGQNVPVFLGLHFCASRKQWAIGPTRWAEPKLTPLKMIISKVLKCGHDQSCICVTILDFAKNHN